MGIYLLWIFSCYFKSIQIRLSWSSPFYKNDAWIWNSTCESHVNKFLWIHSHCRTALLWLKKKKIFIWFIHFSLGNVIVYESVLITCHLPDKMREVFMCESVSPQNMFPLGKKLKNTFSIFAGHLDFIFSEWNVLTWNILFLIKSSKHENALCGMVRSYRSSLEKMFSSYSWNKIKLEWISNQHFKTSLYLKRKSIKTKGTKILTDKHEPCVCFTNFPMYYRQNIIFTKIHRWKEHIQLALSICQKETILTKSKLKIISNF